MLRRSTKPQWDAGRAFAAPSIQWDHILDRWKQKLHGTVSTSDGANPNLATSDTMYSTVGRCPGVSVIQSLVCGVLSVNMIKCRSCFFLKTYNEMLVHVVYVEVKCAVCF